MEEATGRRAFGREGALVVHSCPVHVLLTTGQSQVRRPPRRKEREWRVGGSTTGCRPEESGEGVESAHTSVYVCVL